MSISLRKRKSTLISGWNNGWRKVQGAILIAGNLIAGEQTNKSQKPNSTDPGEYTVFI